MFVLKVCNVSIEKKMILWLTIDKQLAENLWKEHTEKCILCAEGKMKLCNINIERNIWLL